MISNPVLKVLQSILRLITYQPPQQPEPFVLEEEDPVKKTKPAPAQQELQQQLLHTQQLLDYARQLAAYIEELIAGIRRNMPAAELSELTAKYDCFKQRQLELEPLLSAYDEHVPNPEKLFSTSLEQNMKIIKKLYNIPTNKDPVLREFELPAEPSRQALLVYLDGLVDAQKINLAVLQPLMLLSRNCANGNDIISAVMSACLPSNQVKEVYQFNDLIAAVAGGDTALIVDGSTTTLIIDTKGFPQRGIERPQIEQAIRGSQAAFSERLRSNTAQIRLMLPSADLVTEIIPVGNQVSTNCAIMYMQSIASPQLVAEIKRRIKLIDTDYILNTSLLDQFLEDQPWLPVPQSLATERPDRAAANLMEGRVAIMLDGTPFVHIVPVTLHTFFQTVDDYSLSVPAANFMRFLRIMGAILTMILPAAYLAISYFHQEALPTELVLAIAGAREKVPFPALIEILLMEFSFELIREAGVRVPGVLGSTIGIVGAIILGQAAVAANIVSPIMVVIISITGLASFTVADYGFSFALRLARFVFLFLAATFGLVGIAIGLLIMVELLCYMKSFGVPFLAPTAPKTSSAGHALLRSSVFAQGQRPDELNARNNRRQPPVSRQWAYKKPRKENNP